MADDPSMPPYTDSSPAEIRRKVAASQARKRAARRRWNACFRAVLLLGALLLAGPWLLRHGLAHGRHSHGSRFAHARMRHRR